MKKLNHVRLFEGFVKDKWHRKPSAFSDVNRNGDESIPYAEVSDYQHFEAWELWGVDMDEEDKIRPFDYLKSANTPGDDKFVVRIGGEGGKEYFIDTAGYDYARYVKEVIRTGNESIQEGYNIRASLVDNIKKALEGNVYYMPKGTMILKDRTKRERPSDTSMWLSDLNAVEAGGLLYFRMYPHDYSVKIENLESEPQKELKKRYLEFKKSQQEAKYKRSREDWGFGDEGEVGTNPKLKEIQKTIEEIDKLMKTVR